MTHTFTDEESEHSWCFCMRMLDPIVGEEHVSSTGVSLVLEMRQLYTVGGSLLSSRTGFNLPFCV